MLLFHRGNCFAVVSSKNVQRGADVSLKPLLLVCEYHSDLLLL